MQEQKVWSGGPSQIMHFVLFFLCCAAGYLLMIFPEESTPIPIAFLPAMITFWHLLTVQHTEYEITTERIITYTGIFSRTIDELELYRIKDFRIQQPFHLRVMGLANIVLLTSDLTSPKLVIHAIPNARTLLDQIRELVEYRRDAKGVRSLDINQYVGR